MKKNLLAILIIALAVTACKKSSTTTTEATPTASFTVKHLTIGPNNTDTFINSSTNAASYSWNFGDNSGTATSTDANYGYATPGTYTVTLTAYSSDKTKSNVATQTITVDTAYSYPLASISVIPNSHYFPLDSTFQVSDASSTFTTSCFWDFGDGATSTLPNPTHKYTSAGPQQNGGYYITLTVYHNGKGLQSTTKTLITTN